MPHTLIPPGRRKPGTRQENKFYYVRFKVAAAVGQSRDVEVSTKTRDKAAAERLAPIIEGRYRANLPPAPGAADVTFEQAALIWRQQVEPTDDEWWRVERLFPLLGPKLLTAIGRTEIVAAADALYSRAQGASRNRQVLTPASSILHWAAEEERGWCPYRKFKREREDEAQTRSLRQDQARRLIAAAKRLRCRKELQLLVWLFRHGPRISEALRVNPKRDIDRRARTYRKLTTKRRGRSTRWIEKPIHPDVQGLLTPADLESDRLFPWYDRWQVYRALAPICEAAGVRFTPHMARHSMASWMVDEGVDLLPLMEAGDWEDPRSVRRYAGRNAVKRVRAANAKLAPLFQPKRRKAG